MSETRLGENHGVAACRLATTYWAAEVRPPLVTVVRARLEVDQRRWQWPWVLKEVVWVATEKKWKARERRKRKGGSHFEP